MSLTAWAIEGECDAGAGRSRFWRSRMICDVFLFIVFLFGQGNVQDRRFYQKAGQLQLRKAVVDLGIFSIFEFLLTASIRQG